MKRTLKRAGRIVGIGLAGIILLSGIISACDDAPANVRVDTPASVAAPSTTKAAPSTTSTPSPTPKPEPKETSAEKLIDEYPDGDPATLTSIATAETCDDLQGWADASYDGYVAYAGKGQATVADEFFAHFMASSDRLIDMKCPGWK